MGCDIIDLSGVIRLTYKGEQEVSEVDKAVEQLKQRLSESAHNPKGREVNVEDTEYGSGDPELADDIAKYVARFWDE